MNKLFILLIGTFYTLSIHAQQVEYKSFAEEGKVWNMVYNNPEAEDTCPSFEFCYFMKGDTLISGWECKKMYVYNIDNHKTTEYEMAVYETDRKVFFIPKDTRDVYKLYDFSIPVGNVIEVTDAIHPEWKIKMRNNEERDVITDNISRRCLHVNRTGTSDEDYASGWWIEGIGSELGPLNTWSFEAMGNSCFLTSCEIDGQKVLTMVDFKKEIDKSTLTEVKNISNVKTPAPTKVHDLSGRRTTHPAKGIYIRQGRKVVK